MVKENTQPNGWGRNFELAMATPKPRIDNPKNDRATPPIDGTFGWGPAAVLGGMN